MEESNKIIIIPEITIELVNTKIDRFLKENGEAEKRIESLFIHADHRNPNAVFSRACARQRII